MEIILSMLMLPSLYASYFIIGRIKENALAKYIFYIYSIMFVSIGSLLIILNLSEYYLIDHVSSNSRVIGYLIIIFTTPLLYLGMLIGDKIAIKYKVAAHISENKYFFILLVIATFSFIYTLNIIGLPIDEIISSSHGDLNKYRQSVQRNFQGSNLVKELFFIIFIKLCILYAFIKYYLKRQRVWLFIYLMLLPLVLYSLLYNLGKSSLIIFILSHLVVIYVLKGIAPKFLIYLLSALAALFTISMYLFLGEDIDTLLNYNSGLVGRILFGQQIALYLSVELFPQEYAFLGFNGISQFVSNIFDSDFTGTYSRILKSYIDPSRVATGEAGVLNGIYLAEAWTSFGYPAVIFGSFLAGFYIQFVYKLFNLISSFSFKTTLKVFYIISLPIGGGFYSLFYNPLFFIFISTLFILAIFFELTYLLKKYLL